MNSTNNAVLRTDRVRSTVMAVRETRHSHPSQTTKTQSINEDDLHADNQKTRLQNQ